MSRSRFYQLAMLLIMGGCAGPMGTLRQGPPPPAPVTAFDGSYSNTIRVVGSFGSNQAMAWCQTPGQPVITVKDGQFAYSVPHPTFIGNPTPVFQATIGKDGTFLGQMISGIMSGRIQGSHIEGRIDGSACIYAFSGYRV